MEGQKPIFDREHFVKGVNYIQDKAEEASSPVEKAQAYLLYAQLIGAHTLVGISNILDRIFPSRLEQPPEKPDNG